MDLLDPGKNWTPGQQVQESNHDDGDDKGKVGEEEVCQLFSMVQKA